MTRTPAELIADLRETADKAEAAGKLHWAKTMRDAATLMQVFESSEHIAKHFACAESDLSVCHECDGFGMRPWG